MGGVLDSTRRFLSGDKDGSKSKPPYFLAVRSSTTLIVFTVVMAIFTDIFFYALIIPVIPFSLTVQVGIPEEEVQSWTSILLACYSVALFVGSPLAGVYADHTSSRRWPLLLGLIALAASTLLLCLGNSIALLIVGRILQGLSAAVVWTVGCALLIDTMASATGIAMGYVGIGTSVGLLIAPVIGGAVYAAAGYYAVYYVAFGVIFLDILLRLFMIEKKVARQWLDDNRSSDLLAAGESFDVEASAAAAVTITPSPASEPKDGDEKSAAASAPPQESKTKERIEAPSVIVQEPAEPQVVVEQPDMRRLLMFFLKSPRLLAALYGLFAQAGIMMGFDAVLALFVRRMFQWDSTAAGILFLSLFLPGFVSPLVGWVSDRYGARWPALFGFCLAIPLLVCLRFVTENRIEHKILLGFLLAPLGVALAFSNTPLMAEISYAIEDKIAIHPGFFGEKGVYGLGYGLFTMAFALGGVIGPLWAGYVVDAAGWGTMTWSISIWAATGAVVIFFWCGPKQSPPPTSLDNGTGSNTSRRGK
ncbi:MFS general substrate transporter [Durotheca rogersii]|uniref:MFS general substrate transporter n=1 Tax=Durotheca rogersii TaxID=419775 RepID=UPI0022202524|nr:MFS general substrate transporter [Durotheca rogersii]KAI5860051.1 MFS general substrate transporter [Durotheca rogersii]